MTAIAASTDERYMVMGGDSSVGNPSTNEIYSALGPRKCFRRGSYLIGFTGSFRVGQCLSRLELPEPECRPEELFEHMSTRFVPAVAEGLGRDLETVGAIWLPPSEASPESRGTIAVGVRGRLFGLTVDLSLLEFPGVPGIALGVGRSYAYGALHALAGTGSAEERVRKALAAAAAYSPMVREPFHLVKMQLLP